MKNFLKNLKTNIKTKKVYQAYLATIGAIVLIIALGLFGENCKIFNGAFLSDHMAQCFAAHQQKEFNVGYLLYYLFLYILIIPIYLIPALYIIAKRNEASWCSFVIFISVVFLIFINAYLTEMLQYKDETCQSIYEMHLTSFISVCTAIIGTAGIKLGFLLTKERQS